MSGSEMGESRFFDNMAFWKTSFYLNQFYTRKQEWENVLSQDTFGYFLDLSDFVFVSKFKKGNFDTVTHSLKSSILKK